MRDQRSHLDPRPCKIEMNVSRYAEGSCMIETGHTKVLCAATIDESVPSWMKGKGSGWVTAEYNMLPRSTHTRSKREREKLGGRTHEIQRLIARALRACVDLNKIGERQIIVDCDVIQADGGTRTASITGACIALGAAISKLIVDKKIQREAWVDTVQAVSVGMKKGEVLVDLDYNEDASCDVDMNFVRTGKGDFVEIQGTGEKKAFTEEEMLKMLRGAKGALNKLQSIQNENLTKLLG
ncbi:MAG: ribonuclease PH [Bdellovibrionales bacterium]|nr:ribonuclease PH [Bdellovibrionales bacterium]